MLEMIKQHLGYLSASQWSEYQAQLAPQVAYEELATQTKSKGAESYVDAVKRWKRAFPDLRASIISSFAAGDKVLVEVEWQGTHSGPFEGPFGTVAATNRRGNVTAAMVFTVRDGKIQESRHYFDLLTVLTQIGVAPMIGAPAPTRGGASASAKHR